MGQVCLLQRWGWTTICAVSLPLSGGNTYLQDIYGEEICDLNTCVGFKGMKSQDSDFPGGPVVRTLHIHCRGHGCDPWLGNEDPHMPSVVAEKSKKKKNSQGSQVTLTLGGHILTVRSEGLL